MNPEAGNKITGFNFTAQTVNSSRMKIEHLFIPAWYSAVCCRKKNAGDG
jgi:hypothetical protein